MKLIAFTGKAGTGKTTAADYLSSKYRYQESSFAANMKKGVKQMFDLGDTFIYGDKEEKERIIPSLSKKKPISGRMLLQTIGTEWGRNMIDPDIWIYPIDNKFQMMKSIPGFVGMVLSDLRFENEAKWVKDNGGIVVEIITPAEAIMEKSRTDSHESEGGVPHNMVDVRIVNYKNFDFFRDIDTSLFAPSPPPPSWPPSPPSPPSPPPKRMMGGSGVCTEPKNVRDLIVEWADEVFPDRTIKNALDKMVFEEIPEFMLSQKDPMELADIGILLYDIANLAGVDLDGAIRKKMMINKARTWEIDSRTGLMCHKEDKL